MLIELDMRQPSSTTPSVSSFWMVNPFLMKSIIPILSLKRMKYDSF